MYRVLIIARYFGTRIPGLIKYLPEFGWQPVLLTTALPPDNEIPPEITVIETGNRTESNLAPIPDRTFFGRILSLGGEIINYPDSYKNWKVPAVKAGEDLFSREKIDAIVSSSSPVTGHLIARELKNRHQIPWIADLRDLWSQNHNYYYSPIRRFFDRRLERKTLSAADALVTVSPPWADRLGGLHQGKAIYTITNGFDEEKYISSSTRPTSRFTITYTGSIYHGKQGPARFLISLKNLISESVISPDDVEVRFYGPRLAWLEKEISKCGLSGIVKQHGTVPPQVASEKQGESQLLLLLDWDDPAENGWYPLKIFEYLGAGRPILTAGGVAGNAVDALLSETGGGKHAVALDDIKNSLRDFYQEYKLKGEITYHGLREKINKYTHRNMTGAFVAILEGLIQR